MPGTVVLLSVHTPWGVWFLASIKCVYDNDFHLSFYFLIIYNFRHWNVRFCRILSDFVESFVHCIQYILSYILHTLLFYYVHCIQYIFPLYIAYNIIPLLKCIQYFFLYLLDKVHFICFTNFISNTYIPTFVNSKHIKNIFYFFSWLML